MRVPLLGLVCFACIIWRTDQQQCHSREASLCFMPYLMTVRTSLIPRDERALNKTCQLWMDEQKCMHKYGAKCLDDMHQLGIRLAFGRVMRLQNELCGQNDQMRNDFLKAAPCLSETVKLTHETCLENLENVLYLVTGEDVEVALNAGCCFYERFYSCFRQHLSKRCESQHLPVVEEAFRMSMFGTIHNVCSSTDPETDGCIELLSRNITNPSDDSSYLTRLIMLVFKH